MPNPDNNRWRIIIISINFTISEIIIIFAQKYIHTHTTSVRHC